VFKNRLLVVLGVLSLSLVAMVISFPFSNTPIAAERGRAAGVARWTAMGEYYQNRAEAEDLISSRTADVARWEAMGRYYQQSGADASLSLLRSRTADTARWRAMAEYYQKLTAAEAQNLARARAAEAARWTAMGKYYARFGSTAP
jgi:hypothetical protein